MTQGAGNTDKVFSGSIPEVYETYLVPLIFESYATDLARRLASRSRARVLEVAAGTGVVTRALASSLPTGVPIVATDLNQAMLDHASTIATARPVEWRQADAMQLPFDDGGFLGEPEIVTVTARSRAQSARSAAIAFCQGTPLRSEIESRGASRLDAATDAAAEAIASRFGHGAVDGKIQAHIVTVER